MQDKIKAILTKEANQILIDGKRDVGDFKVALQNQIWEVLTEEFERVVGFQAPTSSDGQKLRPNFASLLAQAKRSREESTIYKQLLEIDIGMHRNIDAAQNEMQEREPEAKKVLINFVLQAKQQLKFPQLTSKQCAEQITLYDSSVKIYDAHIQFYENALKVIETVDKFAEAIENINTGVKQTFDRQIKMLTEKFTKDIKASYALMLAAAATLIVALTPILSSVTLASTGVAIASAPIGIAAVCGVATYLLYNQSSSLNTTAKGDKAIVETLKGALDDVAKHITENAKPGLNFSNDSKELIEQAKAHAKTINDAAREISGLGVAQNR
ncbi:MAG: hypothetical protein K0R73_802 [Candidatus Midichloriaceae bacterium]|jgi:hypothetical protein|nr:hypothetical protein [Candidatus Midichloriaceae bacterium]